jgi:hypothetical protein
MLSIEGKETIADKLISSKITSGKDLSLNDVNSDWVKDILRRAIQLGFMTALFMVGFELQYAICKYSNDDVTKDDYRKIVLLTIVPFLLAIDMHQVRTNCQPGGGENNATDKIAIPVNSEEVSCAL